MGRRWEIASYNGNESPPSTLLQIQCPRCEQWAWYLREDTDCLKSLRLYDLRSHIRIMNTKLLLPHVCRRPGAPPPHPPNHVKEDGPTHEPGHPGEPKQGQ